MSSSSDTVQRPDRAPAQFHADTDHAVPTDAAVDILESYLTPAANAERFIQTFASDVRSCPVNGAWYLWSDGHWERDQAQRVAELAKRTVKGLWDEAVRTARPEDRAKLVWHARRSHSASALREMLRWASTDQRICVSPEDLDTNPMLLNVRNGTLDLTTGALRQPHRREDLITRMIPLDFDPDAACPRFLSFLEEVLQGDQELTAYLQRCLGYSLTGDTSEHVFFILVGPGGNGKTTLLELFRELLGPYGSTADMSTFLRGRVDRIREDLASLAGKRFVTAAETDGRDRLDEVAIKRLTGGDTMRSRFLFQNGFEFRPELKLWFAVNRTPAIHGTDEGIWRRVHLVPFEARIRKVDLQLPKELRRELPGILAWAVEGCQAWLEQGLNPPAAIRKGTDEYRREQDPVGRFLDECCLRRPGLQTPAGRLYRAYRSWSPDEPLSTTEFGKALTARTILQKKTGGVCFRTGIALLSDHLEASADE